MLLVDLHTAEVVIMAITDFSGIIAGSMAPLDIFKIGATMEAAGVLHTMLYSNGSPGAATAPTPGLSGSALTSYSGQIPWTNPVSGNTYLSRLAASASVAGKLVIVDRLWHNSGLVVTTTTGQTINSVTFPARDRNGATSGAGVMVGIEVSTATTNASAVTNTTLTYTNSAGVGSKTGTIASFPATAVAGTFVPFSYAAGDIGVGSIQSCALGTSYGAGTIHLVAYRIIAELPMPLANTGYAIDALTGGFPRLFDNSVLQILWMPSATTAVNISGSVVFTQG